MRPFLFKPNVLLFVSITGSLLLHWAIFTNIIVVFSTLKEPHKPTIISLGAILGSSDVVHIIDGNTPDPAPLNGLAKIKNASQLYTGTTGKPWQQKASDPKAKRTLKTAGMPNPDDHVKAQDLLPQAKDIRIEYEIEAYKPLRYGDND